MIAGAATSGVRRAAPIVTPPNTNAIELQGAELAAEVARLRERLQPADQPQQPARNLFQFSARALAFVGRRPAAPAGAARGRRRPCRRRRSRSIGLADDGADGRRTAIISGFGDLFLVKDGDSITSRYRVIRIDADGVELARDRRQDVHHRLQQQNSVTIRNQNLESESPVSRHGIPSS